MWNKERPSPCEDSRNSTVFTGFSQDSTTWMSSVISRTKRVCRNEISVQNPYEIGILCLAPPTLIFREDEHIMKEE